MPICMKFAYMGQKRSFFKWRKRFYAYTATMHILHHEFNGVHCIFINVRTFDVHLRSVSLIAWILACWSCSMVMFCIHRTKVQKAQWLFAFQGPWIGQIRSSNRFRETSITAEVLPSNCIVLLNWNLSCHKTQSCYRITSIIHKWWALILNI